MRFRHLFTIHLLCIQCSSQASDKAVLIVHGSVDGIPPFIQQEPVACGGGLPFMTFLQAHETPWKPLPVLNYWTCFGLHTQSIGVHWPTQLKLNMEPKKRSSSSKSNAMSRRVGLPGRGRAECGKCMSLPCTVYMYTTCILFIDVHRLWNRLTYKNVQHEFLETEMTLIIRVLYFFPRHCKSVTHTHTHSSLLRRNS